VWVCESCTFENEDQSFSSNNHLDRCGACGSARPLKARRSQITLAQQRGLVGAVCGRPFSLNEPSIRIKPVKQLQVPAPPPKLSLDEWERCEGQAIERGDANHPCSICREPFGVQEQVILSCSHMFHLACMQSFERYSASAYVLGNWVIDVRTGDSRFLRTKQRVCPLCRKENYQKRMTSKAAVIHRVKCVVRLQVRADMTVHYVAVHTFQMVLHHISWTLRRRCFEVTSLGNEWKHSGMRYYHVL
jgi:hypothetical protein